MAPLLKASDVSTAPSGWPTAPVAASSLVGGYAVARLTKVRPLGGVALAAGGAWCVQRWQRSVGTPTAVGLLAVYLGSFGASHPLARKVGAWPSVLAVAGITGTATWVLADRRR